MCPTMRFVQRLCNITLLALRLHEQLSLAELNETVTHTTSLILKKVGVVFHSFQKSYDFILCLNKEWQ